MLFSFTHSPLLNFPLVPIYIISFFQYIYLLTAFFNTI